jgi:hypothetical protein
LGGHGVFFCTHPLLSPRTLLSAFSILLSLPLYPTLSALLSLISGDRDGDRRQGLGMAFVLPLLSPSILFSLFITFRMFYSLSLYLTPSILLDFVIPGDEDRW